MASRTTAPEPFPIRGTPAGYRDRWEADDEAIIEALTAERERLIVTARESAASRRRGKRRAPDPPRQPAASADRIVSEP